MLSWPLSLRNSGTVTSQKRINSLDIFRKPSLIGGTGEAEDESQFVSGVWIPLEIGIFPHPGKSAVFTTQS